MPTPCHLSNALFHTHLQLYSNSQKGGQANLALWPFGLNQRSKTVSLSRKHWNENLVIALIWHQEESFWWALIKWAITSWLSRLSQSGHIWLNVPLESIITPQVLFEVIPRYQFSSFPLFPVISVKPHIPYWCSILLTITWEAWLGNATNYLINIVLYTQRLVRYAGDDFHYVSKFIIVCK